METEDNTIEEVSPQELQHQITSNLLSEADSDNDGKISLEDFTSFAHSHPEVLIVLVRLRRILLELLSKCKTNRLIREREERAFGHHHGIRNALLGGRNYH